MRKVFMHAYFLPTRIKCRQALFLLTDVGSFPPQSGVIYSWLGKMRRYTVVRIIIVIVGVVLAYWVYPRGLLGTPWNSWNLEQIVRASAFVVIFFWTLTFAINIGD